MSLHRCLRTTGFLFFALIVILFSGATHVSAQIPEVIIEIGDVVGRPGEQVLVPVYLSNYLDTVAAFAMYVQMDRPGLGTFSTGNEYDTLYWKCNAYDGASNCIDSSLTSQFDDYDFITIDSLTDTDRVMVDSSGALTSGWEYLKGNSLTGQFLDAKIVGLADYGGAPVVPDISPQENGVLFYLPVNIPATPDPLAGDTLKLMVNRTSDAPQLSDPWGTLIGYEFQTYVDTNLFFCFQYDAGEVCLLWQQVAVPPYDSMEVVVDSIYVMDEIAFQIIDGSIRLNYCGFVGQGPDIVQLTDIVDHLFGGQDIPPALSVADCDCSCGIDIIDLTTAVDYLFGGIPLPLCQ